MTSLDRLEALEKEATKGLWGWRDHTGTFGYGGARMIVSAGADPLIVADPVVFNSHDEEFVVALRNAAPALIAVARAAERVHALYGSQRASLDTDEADELLEYALARLDPEAESFVEPDAEPGLDRRSGVSKGYGSPQEGKGE